MKCVTSPATQAITARAPGHPLQRSPASLCVPSARQKRRHRATFRRSRQAAFGRPLQAAVAEHVANNSLQHISYRIGFYRVNRRIHTGKPATGGEGVRPGYTTATATHNPPRTFFRQLAPFALAHHRRHAIVHLVVSSSYKGIARCASQA